MADRKNDLIVLTPDRASPLPALMADASPCVSRGFVQFITANIRNRHTREAYSRDRNSFLA